jgi:hypothetical protein
MRVSVLMVIPSGVPPWRWERGCGELRPFLWHRVPRLRFARFSAYASLGMTAFFLR